MCTTLPMSRSCEKPLVAEVVPHLAGRQDTDEIDRHHLFSQQKPAEEDAERRH
jgi:hypothetical protein